MSEKKGVHFRTTKTVEVIAPELKAKLADFRMRLAVISSGYPKVTDWHPGIQDNWGTFPNAQFERRVIFRGSAEDRAYNHHQSITKFGSRYVASWSSGFLHEDHVGQEVRFSWSDNGVNWSSPQVIAQTPVESKLVRNNVGLYVSDGNLYCYVGVAKDFRRDVAKPGMNVLEKQRIRLGVYETTDLKNWTLHEGICDNIYIFEPPRKTKGGKLLCGGRNLNDRNGMFLIWDETSKPEENPRVVKLPKTENVIPGQCTWYQTDDGRLWMFVREYNLSCFLGLAWSDDEGETWSELFRTDFPNTFSRAFAGRLKDGRYYIVGNNYDRLLDRTHLLIALSDDGHVFNRQYTLVEGDTTRRINGRHKEDGYHYPNCLVDGNNLRVIYSVNKEDIEVGMLDVSKID
jgi:hypothetical protein